MAGVPETSASERRCRRLAREAVYDGRVCRYQIADDTLWLVEDEAMSYRPLCAT